VIVAIKKNIIKNERMIKIIDKDGNHYCHKCKNIILLPNVATDLCNTCFKEECEEKNIFENKNNQTKTIVGINKDVFHVGKWYRIKCENGDITIAMLSAIHSMHIELNCLVYVKEDDCLVNRKIEMHHCNVDAKDLQSGIVKVELLENQG
jgi:hypothetical protein